MVFLKVGCSGLSHIASISIFAIAIALTNAGLKWWFFIIENGLVV